ncbi:MAG: S1 family peptidase [Bacteriovoracaceae bacterium]|nr:S1 family peptidase [Bacteriovoracaceae bacterium]
MWLFILMLISHPVKAVDWNEFNTSVGILVQKAGGVSTCSGVLLSPTVVLTAAHCVDGFISAKVSNSENLSTSLSYTGVKRGEMHPGYRGNLPGGSIDVGLFHLEAPYPLNLNYPKISDVNELLPFERIGYGGRSGRNVRTWVDSVFQVWFGSYIKVTDKLGVLGDSGGPVYQRQNNVLKLIGVHTGRVIGMSGNLESTSFVQPLGKKEMDWINHQVQF